MTANKKTGQPNRAAAPKSLSDQLPTQTRWRTKMRNILLATATTVILASVPAFAHTTTSTLGNNCTQETMNFDPVTCDNDDRPDGTSAGPAQTKGDNVLNATKAGQGVLDSLQGLGGSSGKNGKGGKS